MPDIKPLHKHDCQECTFLGTFNNQDLYTCAQFGEPTYIARWSSNGPDYTSQSKAIYDQLKTDRCFDWLEVAITIHKLNKETL